MALSRRSSGAGGRGSAIWPGFVDAMSALLLVLMFVLSIFMITQFFLRQTITGQDAAIAEQIEQISEQEAAIAEREEEISEKTSVIDQQTVTITEQSSALQQLEGRLAELADILSLEQTERSAAESRERQVSARLSETTARLDETSASLSAARTELEAEREAAALAAAKREAIEALVIDLQDETMELSEALSSEEQARLAEAAAAEALRQRLADAETELTAAEMALDRQRAQAEETLTLLAAARATEAELRESLTEEMTDAEEKAALLAVARRELAEQGETSAEDQRAIALLNEQLDAFRGQLAAVQRALDATEAAEGTDLTERIEDLGTRLNAALADKVDELSRYRSEFFGRVRAAAEGREGVSIVGDRFVFPSEVLFGGGSADLGPEGEEQLSNFAAILRDIAADIPEDVNWILRIDGHTDKRPLRARAQYADNWELSQARALSVARYLINEENLAPERVAPTGFGEFQPIDTGDSPAALARNRRIELKLTER